MLLDVDIFDLYCSGAVHFTASNNDCGVRDFDMEKFQLSNHFHFPWPVNVTTSLSFFSCDKLVVKLCFSMWLYLI